MLIIHVILKGYIVSIIVDCFGLSASIHCEYIVVGYWNKAIDGFDK